MSYNNEPKRRPDFTVNQQQPFNAEPPCDALIRNYVTPNDYFYVRNHAPVPSLPGESYRLMIGGDVPQPISLSLSELKSQFPKVQVMATLMCAGNRRDELNKIKTVKGVTWGPAAISNGIWGGVPLRLVLHAAGIIESNFRQYHVCFEGFDICKDNTGYGSSIPIPKAMDPQGDVLLAYEMNGEELPRDHGYPLRVVVPGYIGARSVKWLKSIVVQKEESTNYFQRRDYKLFLPQVNWDNVDQWWDKSPPIQELSVQAAILEPKNGAAIDTGSPYAIKGYALSNGHRIARVDVSLDNGVTWEPATTINGEIKDNTNRYWSWFLWTYTVRSMPSPCRIVCRAWDYASNSMPGDAPSIWNLRGVMNNSWHRIDVVSKSKI
ncbi:Sulfite oxidase, mitochondrial [Trichoplax sp. H2]|uniref:Sulfite oxidase n=1 Tax=Trichoplax adhaerens TaxID=10228 RepID=B3RRA2_TRIAD|nr:hypothetical protein TRIADDRAFT_22538 [Trichoplax adhaerens]EDV26308.1 hypothetical protein TRIADDRAFT_22538 [Trichoplax adhaerens]RDD45231.1 Sulfite oxidase, mitochondrial [Trichoplax sp. H2]|eukprot:XP_002110304.1 hypothetical protein TRIADDRAFT_22538 [Trichoplax adhaerens]